jgi:hypothetical protein
VSTPEGIQAKQILDNTAAYSGATQAELDAVKRELGSVIAKHGHAGRAAYEQAAKSIEGASTAAQGAGVAAQSARTVGGLDAASAKAVQGEIAGGYTSAARDTRSLGSIRDASAGMLAQAGQRYLDQAAAAVPIIGKRIERDVRVEQERARLEREERLAEEQREDARWMQRQQVQWDRDDKLRSEETEKAPSLDRLRVEAKAAGSQLKTARLAELQANVAGARTPESRKTAQRALDAARNRTDEEWAIEAGEMLFPDQPVAGLFDVKRDDNQERARLLGDAEQYLRDEIAASAPSGRVSPNQVDAYYARQNKALTSERIAKTAVDLAVRSGMTKAQAEKYFGIGKPKGDGNDRDKAIGKAVRESPEFVAGLRDNPSYASAVTAAEDAFYDDLRFSRDALMWYLVNVEGTPPRTAAVVVEEMRPRLTKDDKAMPKRTRKWLEEEGYFG